MSKRGKSAPELMPKEEISSSLSELTQSIDRIYKEIKRKLELRYPVLMMSPQDKRDRSRFYEFHNEYGTISGSEKLGMGDRIADEERKAERLFKNWYQTREGGTIRAPEP